MQALVGQVAGRRQVDACHLEDGDLLDAEVAVVLGDLDRLGTSRVRSAVSSTLIGSGSFHVVSSSGRRLAV
jgi:hypothetical protein